jgi:hypothetical protein
MSIQDLHDIAAQLHKFAEEGGTHRAPTLQETHLLFKTALRAVHELASLERRIAAAAQHPNASWPIRGAGKLACAAHG